MILFLRTSDIGIDSRLRRYGRALGLAGLAHAAAYWHRDEAADAEHDIPVFRFTARLGYRSRLATALCLLRANLFFMATIWRQRRVLDLVHAVDLDTALSAWVMKRLAGVPYVYDIYDHYADSRGLGPPIRGWLDWLERRVIRETACVILADDARRAQHPPIPPERLLVVENVPDDGHLLAEAEPPAGRGGRLRIGYLGTFEARYRGLEDLIAVVEGDERLEMEIAGAGALGDVIAAAAARCERIMSHPPLRHDLGLAMLAGCDVMAGLYYPEVPNHRFAAPNKYFEHLLVGRPLLTSLGTPPGDKVRAHDTGWAVAEGAASIAAALGEALADREVVRRKGRNAAALWQERYSDYFERTTQGDYVAMVRRCARPAIAGDQSDRRFAWRR